MPPLVKIGKWGWLLLIAALLGYFWRDITGVPFDEWLVGNRKTEQLGTSMTETFSDKEIRNLAISQYFEIQKAGVSECRDKTGINHADLLEKLESQYRDVEKNARLRSVEVLRKQNLPYDKFVYHTTAATRQVISKDFCTTLGEALRFRLSNSAVVASGIQNQFASLRKELNL